MSSELAVCVEAIKSENVNALRSLLQKNPYIATSTVAVNTSVTTTLLHLAIPPDGEREQDKHVEIVRLLLEHGAKVDGLGEGPNLGPCTPLNVAAWGGHARLVRQLLEAGASPNGSSITDRNHRPVRTAADHGHSETVNILIEHGAEYSTLDLVQGGLSDRL